MKKDEREEAKAMIFWACVCFAIALIGFFSVVTGSLLIARLFGLV